MLHSIICVRKKKERVEKTTSDHKKKGGGDYSDSPSRQKKGILSTPSMLHQNEKQPRRVRKGDMWLQNTKAYNMDLDVSPFLMLMTSD